jgi:nicotinic acid mononucleotide adenylyltransferase
LALAETAQRRFSLDQIVQVVPRSLPHKQIARPTVEERLEWIAELARTRSDWAVCTCQGGLVVDIVEAWRRDVGDACELFVIAGRDAAERYASWDYGDREPFGDQLDRFTLLVGARGGAYRVAPEHTGRILPFEIAPAHDATSSLMVRSAIASGADWRHLVPVEIHGEVAAAYAGGDA